MVDEQVLLAPFLLGVFGLAQKSADFHKFRLLLDREQLIIESGAKNARNALFQIARLQLQHYFAVVIQRKRKVGVNERHAVEFLLDVGELGGVGLEEVATGRHIEKEVVDRHGSSVGCCGDPVLLDLRSLDDDAGGGFVLRTAGLEFHLCNGGDGRKCLSPEALRLDGEQVVGTRNLGRGVPLETEPRIVERHSLAVIHHLDERTARILDNQLDVACAGIHCVFQQFLDCRSGTLYYLPRRNLVCDRIR